MTDKLNLISANATMDQQKLFERQIRNLAAALFLSLQIQDGNSLVMWLGHGQEKSNRHAVTTWVRAKLAQEGLPPTREALSTLLSLLEKELNSLYA